ncbi:flagellar hook-length control protein FliK [Limimaricola hongkongensis]|uniref:Flagellar hook-length control protein n=1 Tax=Limimaricola hongkongensis DSM 17492 TaxID=1122180 RepID=A0A017HH85_9RHOB|nr:flagellar hook-length control protein FliK [Limimaricola hongkongensis]EYD73144.1 flagellar hook-length control protein [Limimaricola hongkongensis DSM 17492]
MLDPRPPDSRGPVSSPARAMPPPGGDGFAALVTAADASAALRQEEKRPDAADSDGDAAAVQLPACEGGMPCARETLPAGAEGRLGVAPHMAVTSTRSGRGPEEATGAARQEPGPAEPGLAQPVARTQPEPGPLTAPPVAPRGAIADAAGGSAAAAMALAQPLAPARNRGAESPQAAGGAPPSTGETDGRGAASPALFPVGGAGNAPDPGTGGRGDAPMAEGIAVMARQQRAAGTMPDGHAAAPPPRPVAQQLAQPVVAVITAASEGQIELRLDPEELGHVALRMRAEGDRLTLVIAAEQRDTTELIRRHLQELSQEFRALGYRSIGFSFEGGQGGHAGAGRDTRAPDRAPAQEPAGPPPILVPLSAGPPRPGLDLRL